MRSSTLYSLFHASAREFPDAVALEVGPHRLTYAELRDTVRRLAAELVRAAGREPAAVGLLTTRSLAGYAGYLAALRTGATVVPLNPAFPARRTVQMCRAAGTDVVVVDDAGAAVGAEVLARVPAAPVPLREADGWLSRLPQRPAPRAPRRPAPRAPRQPAPWAPRQPAPWAPDRDPERDPERAMPAHRRDDPDAVAYTLFTSGSTGRPKGVPIRHRNVTGYLAYCVDRYRVGPGCRLSQTFDLTFDPSVFDMFVAWAGGATLVVPAGDEVLTPTRWVAERGITHWFSVPSVVSVARRLRMLPPGSMPALRWSLFIGEQLTIGQAREWARAAPNSTVENLYGPTELTVSCAGHRLPADPGAWPDTPNGTVPIGEVYPHLQRLILADGELCVRGPQRFDGYLDPADDAGRFVRHEPGGPVLPVTGRPAPGDWYRTGDRVRPCAGALVHLGRLDAQVKIRGYRIEPGEIEAVLRQHGGVHDAVVLPVRVDGETVLHAVYTGAPGLEPELARLVIDRLPAYMLPHRIRHTAELPTGATGKTDRRSLAQLSELSELAGR